MTYLALAAVIQFSALAAPEQGFAEASQRALATGRPLVVLLGAEWCPACKLMRQTTLPQMTANGALDGVELAYVDVDRQQGLAEKLLRGRALPQLVHFHKTPAGWQSERLTGAQTAERIASLVHARPRAAVVRAEPPKEPQPPVPAAPPSVEDDRPVPGDVAGEVARSERIGEGEQMTRQPAIAPRVVSPQASPWEGFHTRRPAASPAVSQAAPPAASSPPIAADTPDPTTSVAADSPAKTDERATQDSQSAALTVYPIGHVTEAGGRTRIVLDKKYQPGLRGLDEFMHIYVFWWSDANDAAPAHGEPSGDGLTGVFASHSRARPNRITFSLCTIVGVEDNVVEIQGIDATPGAAVLDIRPLGPKLSTAKAIPADWSRTE